MNIVKISILKKEVTGTAATLLKMERSLVHSLACNAKTIILREIEIQQF